MAEKTIAQIFGTGAIRLASGATAPSAGLFIPDSALITGGLTTPSTATAEGHLGAIVVNAQTALTETGFGADTDQSIYVADGFPSFTTRDSNSYRVNQRVFNFAEQDTQSSLNPNRY